MKSRRDYCSWCGKETRQNIEKWVSEGVPDETYHRCRTCSKIIEHPMAPGNKKELRRAA